MVRGFLGGGVTAEVVSRVVAEGFHLLDAAPLRLNSKDTPIPYHPDLWAAIVPLLNRSWKNFVNFLISNNHATGSYHHASAWRIDRRG